MSTATSIATQSAVKAAVTKAVVGPTNEADYNRETYRKFACSIINAACAVPSPIGGGNNGHIYFLESVAAYTTHTSGTGYTKATHLGAINFTGATTNAQVARIKDIRRLPFVNLIQKCHFTFFGFSMNSFMRWGTF